MRMAKPADSAGMRSPLGHSDILRIRYEIPHPVELISRDAPKRLTGPGVSPSQYWRAVPASKIAPDEDDTVAAARTSEFVRLRIPNALQFMSNNSRQRAPQVLRITAAQLKFRRSLRENVELIRRLIAEAARHGSEVVLFPEC